MPAQHMYSYKRGAEGNLHAEEKGTMCPRQQKLEWCGYKSRNAGRPQTLEDARTDPPLEPLERGWSCLHIDFGSVKLILDFWLLEL